MKYFLVTFYLMAFAIVGAFIYVRHHRYNIIGTANWCMVNDTDHSIQCNYETENDCEAYRSANERCVPR